MVAPYHGLSPHNPARLRALVTAVLFLARMLGSSWFAVLETPQSANHVFTKCGTAPPGPAPLASAPSLVPRG